MAISLLDQRNALLGGNTAPAAPLPGTYNVYGPGVGQYQTGLTGQFINPDVGASLQTTALTGRPTDVSGIGQAAGNEAQRQFRAMLGQINERFGALGLPSSSARVRSIARAGQGLAESLQNEILRAGVGAQEAARGRELQATGLLSTIAGQRLGALESAGRLGQVAPYPGYDFGAAFGGGGGARIIGGGLGGVGSALRGGFTGGGGPFGISTTPTQRLVRSPGYGGAGTGNVLLPGLPRTSIYTPAGIPGYGGIGGFEGAHGGRVMGGMDTGEDTVPAMLRPGEVVVPPELVPILAEVPALRHLINRRPQMVDGMQHAQLGARIGMGYADPAAYEDANRGYEILKRLQYENPMIAGILSAQSDLNAANPSALAGFARYVDVASQPEMLAAAGSALPGALPGGDTFGQMVAASAPQARTVTQTVIDPDTGKAKQIQVPEGGSVANRAAYFSRFEPRFQGFQEGGQVFSDPYTGETVPSFEGTLGGQLLRYITSLGGGRTPVVGAPALAGAQPAASRAVPTGATALPNVIPESEFVGPPQAKALPGGFIPGEEPLPSGEFPGGFGILGQETDEEQRLTGMRDDAARRYGLLRYALATGRQGSNENLLRLAPLYEREFQLTQAALGAYQAQQFGTREALQKAANEVTLAKAQALRDRATADVRNAEMQRRALAAIAAADKPEAIIAAIRNFKNLPESAQAQVERFIVSQAGGDPDDESNKGWWGSLVGMFSGKKGTVSAAPKAPPAPSQGQVQGEVNSPWQRFGVR